MLSILLTKLSDLKDMFVSSIGRPESTAAEVEILHDGKESTYDRIIDGAGRLPRLMIMAGVFIMFIMAGFNPAMFTAWAAAIGRIPENMWVLIYVVVGSWAGTKLVRDIKTPTTAVVTKDPAAPTLRGRFENVNQTDLPKSPIAVTNATIDEWKKNAV